MVAWTQTALRHVPDVVESDFAGDVIAGLPARPKQLSPKYFYDELGAHGLRDRSRRPHGISIFFYSASVEQIAAGRVQGRGTA